jgi:hypothetical protein
MWLSMHTGMAALHSVNLVTLKIEHCGGIVHSHTFLPPILSPSSPNFCSSYPVVVVLGIVTAVFVKANVRSFR